MTGDQHDDASVLEQAFSTGEMRRAPGGCPSEDELWASAAGELDPAADEEVVLHLARCGECSTIWRLAREMLPADHLSTASVVAIEDRRWSRSWRRVLLPAAAAVLVGVGLGAGLFLRTDSPAAPVFRQQADDAVISPSPETARLPRAACRLRWTAGPEGTRYDLVVSDGELKILATVKGLDEAEYTLPREKIPVSAIELFWRVTAHLPDGTTVSSDTFTSSIGDVSPSAAP
jgi:hypothetical protein